MTRPPDPQEDREVLDAYRALPPAGPGSELDARIRNSVAAELAATPPAKVIAFPWWRRASLPLAAAASLMIAVGLGRWWLLDGGAQEEERAMMEGTAPAAAPAPAADLASRQMKDLSPKRDADAVRRNTAAATPAARPVEHAASEARTIRAEPGALRRDVDARNARAEESTTRGAIESDSVAAPAQAAKPAAAPAPALKAAPASERRLRAAESGFNPVATLDEVRQLLASGQHDLALSALRRWRVANPQAALPADLLDLQAELAREAPAKDGGE